jgi:hypothetical protein
VVQLVPRRRVLHGSLERSGAVETGQRLAPSFRGDCHDAVGSAECGVRILEARGNECLMQDRDGHVRMGHVTGENQGEGGVPCTGCCFARAWPPQAMELSEARRDRSSGPGERRVFPAAMHTGWKTLRHGTDDDNVAGTARRMDRSLKEGPAVVHQLRLGCAA